MLKKNGKYELKERRASLAVQQIHHGCMVLYMGEFKGFGFFVFECWSSLFLVLNPYQITWFTNIFSHTVGCLLVLQKIVLWSKTFLIFMKSNLLILLLLVLCCIWETIAKSKVVKIHLFLSNRFVVLALIFRSLIIF